MFSTYYYGLEEAAKQQCRQKLERAGHTAAEHDLMHILALVLVPPSYQAVTYSEIADIDFTTPHLKRRNGESADSPSTSASTRIQVAPPSDEEIARLHQDLFHAGKPVLLSLVPEYSDHNIPLCASGVMPNPLTDLFISENVNLSYPDLLKKCEEVFETYTITADVAKHIQALKTCSIQ